MSPVTTRSRASQASCGYVLERMDGPCGLVAQSMGGVIALSLAIEHPELVQRLVLTGTSGGIDVARFGGEDWRAEREKQRRGDAHVVRRRPHRPHLGNP